MESGLPVLAMAGAPSGNRWTFCPPAVAVGFRCLFRACTGDASCHSLSVWSCCRCIGGLERKKQVAFRDFLEHPDQWHEENLVKTVSGSEADCVRLLGKALREKQLACARAAADMEDYEEYVEAWAHEIKTPLSLLTLMLDNQRGDMPESVDYKLDYIRNQMQEYVNQMLYYARLKSVRKDYLFEFVDLRDCLEEVLEDYRLLLEEKQFLVQNQVPHTEVFTDRRGLQFLLGQVVSNAVKYSSADPELALRWETKETEAILRIRDNGMGVRTCDLPYIFEKVLPVIRPMGKRKQPAWVCIW